MHSKLFGGVARDQPERDALQQHWAGNVRHSCAMYRGTREVRCDEGFVPMTGNVRTAVKLAALAIGSAAAAVTFMSLGAATANAEVREVAPAPT